MGCEDVGTWAVGEGEVSGVKGCYSEALIASGPGESAGHKSIATTPIVYHHLVYRHQIERPSRPTDPKRVASNQSCKADEP